MKEVKTKVNSTLTLECESWAVPPPTISWYKDGRVSEESLGTPCFCLEPSREACQSTWSHSRPGPCLTLYFNKKSDCLWETAFIDIKVCIYPFNSRFFSHTGLVL